MATRQLRISDADRIQKEIGQFVGKKINIVLRDGTAMLGVIKALKGQDVEFRNMAQRIQRFPLSSIAEIYIDSLV